MRWWGTRISLAAFVALSMMLIPVAALAETVALAADLSGTVQVPANPSKGKGTLTATYDTDTKTFSWSGTYAGLTGQPIAAHFHGPADTKMNAPVALNMDKHASPFQGTATLTDAQAADLLAGRWYANFHTPSYPGGELRGQVVRTK